MLRRQARIVGMAAVFHPDRRPLLLVGGRWLPQWQAEEALGGGTVEVVNVTSFDDQCDRYVVARIWPGREGEGER